MANRKCYRVIEINNETGERWMTVSSWSSKKKAIEWAEAFVKAINDGAKRNLASYEIKQV